MKPNKKISEVSFELSEYSRRASQVGTSTRRDSHDDRPGNKALSRKQSLQWIKAVNTHFDKQVQWDKESNRKLMIFSIMLTGSLYVLIILALTPLVFKILSEVTDVQW